MRKVRLRGRQRTWTALLVAAVGTVWSAGAAGSDWNNLSGNNQRNGLSDVTGPAAPDLLWENRQDFSIISWAPFIMDGRVFTVRESGFPQQGGQANDEIIAYDLESGMKLWCETLPFGGDTSQEWIAWILGVRDGRVYASRGGNGTTAPVYAYDASSGLPIWVSDIEIGAFAYEGVVFAPDGDLIVGWHTDLYRLDGNTGAMDWHATRNCSVSGSCGPAVTATAVFVDEVAPGGQIVTKFALADGERLYSSPVAPGFLTQKSPFLSTDGSTVYYPRTQNNDLVDFLYAFDDTGTALETEWFVPIHWTPEGYGIDSSGGIYALDNDVRIVRLDPVSGKVLDQGPVLQPVGAIAAVRMAVGADGTVYVNNGWASTPANNGRLYAFSADLSTELFSLTLDRPNQGGPALGGDGTLVVCDRFGVYAYRTSKAPCPADTDDNGFVDVADLVEVVLTWGACPGCPGDVNGDGVVDVEDMVLVVLAWGECP